MRMKWIAIISSFLLVILLPLNWPVVWQVQGQTIKQASDGYHDRKAQLVNPLMQADLNQDGQEECLVLKSGVANIQDCAAKTLWQSPATWDVREAQISDLNRDGVPEVTLLVWRPFKPWPIDRDDPSGGRIKDFHDRANQSCHVILIHWARGAFVELWAGSALVRPVSQLAVADVDGDSGQELVALEGYYDSPFKGGSLTVWRWRGFGFVLVGKVNKMYQSLWLMQNAGKTWIVTQ